MTAAGGAAGRARSWEGWGARASSPFLWNKGKSVSEASVTPRRAKGAGRVGLATRRKFVRAGTLWQAKREPSLLRGKRAASRAGGGQHGVWALGWRGGRCGGGSPAPSPPPPGRVRSTKPSAQARPSPRPEESASAEPRRKGVGTKLFSAPRQTREFSFFQSPRPTGFAGLRGSWNAESDAEWGTKGYRRPVLRPIPCRPGSHVLRLGLGRGGGCALCVNCWECSASVRARGVLGRPGGVVRKFAGVAAGRSRRVCRSAPNVMSTVLLPQAS